MGVTERRTNDANTSYVYCSINLVSGDHTRSPSVVFEFVTVVKWQAIPILNKKTLDVRKKLDREPGNEATRKLKVS